MPNQESFAHIPMKFSKPIFIKTHEFGQESVSVPMATFEKPLWPSVNRGAKITQKINGISISIMRECMTRSIIVKAHSAVEAKRALNTITTKTSILKSIVEQTSRYAKLEEIQPFVTGRSIYLRLRFTTGEASGHNMVTKAADAILAEILKMCSDLSYVSISGNICVDKKNSAINTILGRGRYLIAEGIVTKDILENQLRTNMNSMIEINNIKNYQGSLLAGSLQSANAHYANMLLGCYLAFGQDAANIVEGSQGFTTIEKSGREDIYFAVTLPNIIVGTVGAGKNLPHVLDNLQAVNCDPKINNKSSRRLAYLIAATVWCGELSLLAAQTNVGELVSSHMILERDKQ